METFERISDETCYKCKEVSVKHTCDLCEKEIDTKNFRLVVQVYKESGLKHLCKKCVIRVGEKYNEILDFRGNDWLMDIK